jgi:hypothetical protein
MARLGGVEGEEGLQWKLWSYLRQLEATSSAHATAGGDQLLSGRTLSRPLRRRRRPGECGHAGAEAVRENRVRVEDLKGSWEWGGPVEWAIGLALR